MRQLNDMKANEFIFQPFNIASEGTSVAHFNFRFFFFAKQKHF